MFFLSQKGSEVAEIVKVDSEKKWFQEFLNELSQSLGIFIHDEGPPIEDPEYVTLPYNVLLQWAMKDWKPFLDSLKGKNWAVIWIARGGFILLDMLENKLSDFIWTYYKPKSNKYLPHEDPDVYDEYSDPAFMDKLAEYSGSKTSLIFIDDFIDAEETNLEAAVEYTLEIAEELEIEIDKTVAICLLTKNKQIGEMPIYGVLTDYNATISVAWGNDSTDGIDERDFTEQKEFIEDH